MVALLQGADVRGVAVCSLELGCWRCYAGLLRALVLGAGAPSDGRCQMCGGLWSLRDGAAAGCR